jgi:hypothetical protein
MSSTGPAPRPSTSAERKKLVEEYQQAKKTEAERLTTEQRFELVRKRRRQVIILSVLLAITGFISFSPPAWLFPQPAPGPSVQHTEASIRFAIYLQAQQVERFRNANGRLPGTLAETGQPLPDINYSIMPGNTYELSSTANTAIRYSSTGSLNQFLGQSMSQLGTNP